MGKSFYAILEVTHDFNKEWKSNEIIYSNYFLSEVKKEHNKILVGKSSLPLKQDLSVFVTYPILRFSYDLDFNLPSIKDLESKELIMCYRKLNCESKAIIKGLINNLIAIKEKNCFKFD